MAKKKDEEGNGKAAEKKDERVEEFDRNLRVILTAPQVAERADRCAHLMAQRDNKAEMAKAAAKHAKSEIDELEATIRRLGAEVRDKACYEPTACIRAFNYRRGTVTETRKDTGEVISERAMTDEERQMTFDDHPKGDNADAGSGGGGGSLDDDFKDVGDEA